MFSDRSALRVVLLSLFLFCIVAAGAPPPANAATPSKYCELLQLRTDDLQRVREQIELAIHVRTSLIREGNPYLVDAQRGSPIDVNEGLMREVAKPILDLSTKAMLGKVDSLASRWVGAMKEQVKAEYEAKRAEIQEIEAERRAIKASGVPVGPNDLPMVATVDFDRDGLPLRPNVQLYRNEVDSYGNPLDLALAVKQSIRGRPGPAEIENRVVQAVIEGVRLRNPDGSVTEYKGIRRRFAEKIKEAARATVESVEQELAENQNAVSPDWEAVISVTMPLYLEMIWELEQKFPIDEAVRRGNKVALEAKNTALNPLEPLVVRADLNPKTGVFEIILEDPAVRAFYETELGTTVIVARKPENKKNAAVDPRQPLFDGDSGIVAILDHGDGTVVSNASSWKYVIQKFASAGFIPVAINLPMAGIGMRITGLLPTVLYMDMRNHWVSRQVPTKPGEVALPVVHVGRSMGSAKGFAHALLFEGPDNVIDAYVETSFSNPRTIDKQLVEVYKQVESGSLKGIVDESLANASALDKELLDMLNEIKARDPEALRLFGDKVLFLQGEGDRDGGPTVIQDLQEFRRDFAPLAHVYTFEDMLKKYPWLKVDDIPDTGLEAMHVLYSNVPNMNPEQAQARFPNVPAEDLPRLQDQVFEVNAVKFGFFDYLADTKSSLAEMTRAKQKFAAYRLKLCGTLPDGRPRRFLDWYREKAQITVEDLAAARPGRHSLAGRLKRVEEYWIAESERTARLYEHAGIRLTD